MQVGKSIIPFYAIYYHSAETQWAAHRLTRQIKKNEACALAVNAFCEAIFEIQTLESSLYSNTVKILILLTVFE